MKNIFVLVCAMVLASGCASGVSSGKNATYFPSPSAPAEDRQTRPAPLNTDPLAWDFGAVAKDTVVQHAFTVSNTAPRPLTIKDVVTSCGCTASAVDKKVLAPGEDTKVMVSFNSKGYNGEVSQFVYINTDDPDNPVIKLTIKARVQ